jgi:ABC-type branched-subunit amino acid transport system permease subunit
MKSKLRPNESRWITIISVSVTLVGCCVAFALGAPDKWLAAIYCTVPTFAGTAEYFRNRWMSFRFWTALSVALLFHAALIWVIFSVFLRRTDDVSLLVCLPFIFIEGYFIYHFVRVTGERGLLRTDPSK